jgi:hypothetical protein
MRKLLMISLMAWAPLTNASFADNDDSDQNALSRKIANTIKLQTYQLWPCGGIENQPDAAGIEQAACVADVLAAASRKGAVQFYTVSREGRDIEASPTTVLRQGDFVTVGWYKI